MAKENKSKGNVPNLRFPGFVGKWETKKLEEIASKIGDGLHGTPVYVEESDYYFINGNNLVNGKVELNVNTKKIDFDTFATNDKKLNSNTLLISINGTIGNIARYNDEKIMLGKSVGYYNFNNNSDFLYYVLQTKSIQDFFKSELTGSTIKNLSLKTLRETLVALPSQIEQDKISIFLSLIDQRIETQNKIIEGLKVQMLGLQEKIFRRKIKLKDKHGNEFPEWEIKNGGDLFFSNSNKNHNSDLPILAITQDQGAVPRESIDYQISVTDKSIESYKIVEIGDFIISLRSFQGGIEYSNYNGICSPAYIILKNKLEVEKLFYKYYFKTADYIKLLNKKLEGIRDGKMISYNYFSEILLPYPSVEEQTKVANILTCFEQKIELEKRILKEYENKKKYLLRNLFI